MSKVTFPGDELRDRREAQGLSVVEVYKRLHIPIRYVEALEDGNVDALPEPCFVIGFLRSYCDVLGLNSERFVNLYHECVRPSHGGFLGTGGASDSTSAPGWRGELATWAAICAILALGWFAYQVVVRPDGENSGRVEAGAPDVTEQTTPQGNPFEPSRDYRGE